MKSKGKLGAGKRDKKGLLGGVVGETQVGKG